MTDTPSTADKLRDAHGPDVVAWLTRNGYLTPSGDWDPADTHPAERKVALSLAIDAAYLARRAYIDHAAILRDILARMADRPPVPVHTFPSGVTLPKAALPSAQIIPFPRKET